MWTNTFEIDSKLRALRNQIVTEASNKDVSGLCQYGQLSEPGYVAGADNSIEYIGLLTPLSLVGKQASLINCLYAECSKETSVTIPLDQGLTIFSTPKISL